MPSNSRKINVFVVTTQYLMRRYLPSKSPFGTVKNTLSAMEPGTTTPKLEAKIKPLSSDIVIGSSCRPSSNFDAKRLKLSSAVIQSESDCSSLTSGTSLYEKDRVTDFGSARNIKWDHLTTNHKFTNSLFNRSTLQVVPPLAPKSTLLQTKYPHCLNDSHVRRRSTEVCVEDSDDEDIVNRNYNEAVAVLNRLQSNKDTLINAKQHPIKNVKVAEVQRCLHRIGFTMKELDALSVIHVSGTKGKGSTCAFTESILRAHGYTTGFFSSPHLVEVRERIRINGRPLSRRDFTRYFWEVYSPLEASQEKPGDMPPYFRFLTALALHVFRKEKVDACVVEVGVGGEYDCTNVVRKPVVCGVTSLGLDHTSILGDTLPEIAWQKAGIFKPGAPAFTAPQPEDAMQVLRDRAAERQTSLEICPSVTEAYPGLQLGLRGAVQRTNASLAVQLAHYWLKNRERSREGETQVVDTIRNVPFSEATITGLEGTEWPGRNQMMRRGDVTYFLDGAHTLESIQQCVEWFTEASEEERKRKSGGGRVIRALLFTLTGDRKSESFFRALQTCEFDLVAFSPPTAFCFNTSADQTSTTITRSSQLERCQSLEASWIAAARSNNDKTSSNPQDGSDGAPDNTTNDKSQRLDTNVQSKAFACISEAVQWLTLGKDGAVMKEDKEVTYPPDMGDVREVQLLVTGSVYLVGGTLKVLDQGSNDPCR